MRRIFYKINFKYIYPVFCIFAIVFITGCNNFDERAVLPVYSSKTYLDKTINVMPFNEMRARIKSEDDKYYGILPFVPYTTMKYDHPGIVYGKDEAFGIILAEDCSYNLRKSKLFKKVYLSMGSEDYSSDYTLEGDMLSTLKEKYVLCYGITVFGCIPLWLIGVPTNYNKCFLSVKLRLIDNKLQKTVWSRKYSLSDGFVQGIIYGDERFTPGITKQLYKKLNHDLICRVIADIRNSLENQRRYK